MNKEYKKLCPFKGWVLENFPFIEADFDAITNYELLCKIVEYLNKTSSQFNDMIDNINYLNNWFENLDVQEEINNKLDDMVESGELQEIIASYLNANALWCFNNVADMKTATNLIDGSFAKTLGYYNKNDGGSALYKIREITNQDTVDNGSIIALNDENLIAELIEKNINVNMFGAYGDGVHDDTTAIQTCLNKYSNRTIYFLSDHTYLISDTLEIPSVLELQGQNERTFIKNTSNNYTFHITTSWTNIKNLNIESSYAINFGTPSTRVGQTKIENIYFKDVKTAINLGCASGYNYFNKCSIHSDGTNKSIILGNNNNTYGLATNYVYLNNITLESTKEFTNNDNIGIYITNNTQYIFIDGCDIVGYKKGLVVDDSGFNINITNTCFYNNQLATYYNKTSANTANILNNINILNCKFSTTGNYTQEIIKNDTSNIYINNIYYKNCNAVQNSLPTYLMEIKYINGCEFDINDMSNNINQLMTRSNIINEIAQFYSKDFTVQDGGNTIITLGNAKNLKIINAITFNVMRKESTYSFTRTNNDDGTKTLTLTSTSGLLQGKAII